MLDLDLQVRKNVFKFLHSVWQTEEKKESKPVYTEAILNKLIFLGNLQAGEVLLFLDVIHFLVCTVSL